MADQPLGRAIIEIEARMGKLETQFKKAVQEAAKGAKGIEDTYKKARIAFDDSLMKKKINEVEALHKKLVTQLKQKVSLNADVKTIDELRHRIDATANILRKAGKDVRDLGDESKAATSKLSAFFSGGIAQATLFATKITAGFYAVKKIYDYAIEGAKEKNLKLSFNVIAQRSGEDPAQLLDEIKRATAGAVKEFELLKAINKGSFLGVDIKAMPTLLKFAAIRAQETGEEINYLVDSIITGLGRKSPLILDNLGLTMKDLDKAVIEVAKSHGVLIKEVDELARAEYLTEAAVKVAQQAIDKSVVSMESLNTQAAQMSSNWDKVAKSASETFVPVFSGILSLFNSLLDVADKLDRKIASIFGGVKQSSGVPGLKDVKYDTSFLKTNGGYVPGEGWHMFKETGGKGSDKEKKKNVIEQLRENEKQLIADLKLINNELRKSNLSEYQRNELLLQRVAIQKELDKPYMGTKMKPAGYQSGNIKPNVRGPLKPVKEPYKPDAVDQSTSDIIYDFIDQSQIMTSSYNVAFDSIASGFDLIRIKAAEAANDTTRFWVNVGNTIANEMKNILLKWGLLNLFSLVIPGAQGVGLGAMLGLTGKAVGGPVSKDRPYIVGERGPELYIPERSGYIVPNNVLKSSGSLSNTDVSKIVSQLQVLNSNVGRNTGGKVDVNVNGKIGNQEIYLSQAKESKFRTRFGG